MRRKLRTTFRSLRPARSHPAQVSFSQAPCFSPSSSVFLRSLLLKVGTSNPLLNLLNGAKPIYQLTHFRWIIYPFILSDNAADVTRGAEAGFFSGEYHTFFALFHWESCEPHKTRCCYIVLLCHCWENSNYVVHATWDMWKQQRSLWEFLIARVTDLSPQWNSVVEEWEWSFLRSEKDGWQEC